MPTFCSYLNYPWCRLWGAMPTFCTYVDYPESKLWGAMPTFSIYVDYPGSKLWGTMPTFCSYLDYPRCSLCGAMPTYICVDIGGHGMQARRSHAHLQALMSYSCYKKHLQKYRNLVFWLVVTNAESCRVKLHYCRDIWSCYIWCVAMVTVVVCRSLSRQVSCQAFSFNALNQNFPLINPHSTISNWISGFDTNARWWDMIRTVFERKSKVF